MSISTHVFIGGLVGADQVGMEAREAHYGPDREETHHHLQHSDPVKSRNNCFTKCKNGLNKNCGRHTIMWKPIHTKTHTHDR